MVKHFNECSYCGVVDNGGDMLESKDIERKNTKICHYCDREQDTWFLYDLNDSIDSFDRSKIPVCNIHFNKLCNVTYTTQGEPRSEYLSSGQQEYIAIKRLEKELGITTRHK